MKKLKLHDGEYKLMQIVWESEPLTSKKLTELCEDKLGWKRTTTYTVLKKLIIKDFLQNEKTIVSSLVPQEKIQMYESHEIINERFNGSLSGFVTAFMGSKELSTNEINELQNLIDAYKEDK